MLRFLPFNFYDIKNDYKVSFFLNRTFFETPTVRRMALLKF